MSDLEQQVAAAVLEEAKSSYALLSYKPSPTQRAFHNSTTLNRLVTSGGRAGKTASCLAEVAMLLLGIHPTKAWHGPITAVVLCLSRQQASMTVQKKLFTASELEGPCFDKPMIPASEIAEYGSVKHGFRFYYDATLRNGSKIHFAWADDEATWKRIQGMQADVVYIDENAGSERLIIELRKRLLDAQSAAEKGLRAPWAGMLIWGATGTIVNPTFEKFREMCLAQFPDHQAFVLKPGETGVISQSAINRLAATLTKEQQAIHITGEQTSADLVRIFAKQWDDKRHMLPADYEPAPDDNLILGYDPGIIHDTGMPIFAIRRQEPRRLYLVKAFLHAQRPLDYDIECLKSWLLGRRLRAVVYDYKANERQKHKQALIQDIMEKFREAGIAPYDNNYVRGDKRHYQGICTMRDYLDPDHYNKNMPARLVVNPSFESGGQLFRQQILCYRGKESTKFTGAGGVVKKDDDLLDPARYVMRENFIWSERYPCGAKTMAVDSPLLTRPEKIDTPMPVEDDSNFARQCRMSKVRTPELRLKELGRFGRYNNPSNQRFAFI